MTISYTPHKSDYKNNNNKELLNIYNKEGSLEKKKMGSF